MVERRRADRVHWPDLSGQHFGQAGAIVHP
jgi:hypothetical protein